MDYDYNSSIDNVMEAIDQDRKGSDTEDMWKWVSRKTCQLIDQAYGVKGGEITLRDKIEKEQDAVGAGDRASNVEASRLLFALFLSEENGECRGWCVQAANGSKVPVVHVDVFRRYFCAEFNTLRERYRVCHRTNVAEWAPVPTTDREDNPVEVRMQEFCRPTPHRNWSGDLPERVVSAGEAALWTEDYMNNGVAAPMIEWQLMSQGGQLPSVGYDKRLSSDPGALRIVTVTCAPTPDLVDGGEDETGGRNFTIDGKRFGPKHERLYFEDDPVEGGVSYRDQVFKHKGVAYGAKSGGRKTKIDKNRRLLVRVPTRFYVSFNHYRDNYIQPKQYGRQIEINPWFMVFFG